MATIPVVEGVARLPEFTRLPELTSTKMAPPEDTAPSVNELISNTVSGAQQLEGIGGLIVQDAKIVIVDATVGGAGVIIPRFRTPDIGGRPAVKTIVITNTGTEVLSVTADGATIAGAGSLAVAAGDTAWLTSVPTEVGAEVLEYAVLIQG